MEEKSENGRKKIVVKVEIEKASKKNSVNWIVRMIKMEDNTCGCNFPFFVEAYRTIDGKEITGTSWGLNNFDDAEEKFESIVSSKIKFKNAV